MCFFIGLECQLEGSDTLFHFSHNSALVLTVGELSGEPLAIVMIDMINSKTHLSCTLTAGLYLY